MANKIYICLPNIIVFLLKNFSKCILEILFWIKITQMHVCMKKKYIYDLFVNLNDEYISSRYMLAYLNAETETNLFFFTFFSIFRINMQKSFRLQIYIRELFLHAVWDLLSINTQLFKRSNCFYPFNSRFYASNCLKVFNRKCFTVAMNYSWSSTSDTVKKKEYLCYQFCKRVHKTSLKIR